MCVLIVIIIAEYNTILLYPPLHSNKLRGGRGGGILESSCLAVCPSVCNTFVWKISGEPLNSIDATKLGMMVRHHDPECHVKRFGSYLQSQGHRSSVIS